MPTTDLPGLKQSLPTQQMFETIALPPTAGWQTALQRRQDTKVELCKEHLSGCKSKGNR